MGRDRAADFDFHQGEKSPLSPLEKTAPKKEEPKFAWKEDARDTFRIDAQALTDQGVETDTDAEERVQQMPRENHDLKISEEELVASGLQSREETEKRVADMPQGSSPEENLARTEAREEMEEVIKALREKVSVLKLEQADASAQVAILKKQVAATTEETLPALTGERVKQLKEYQKSEERSLASLAEYQAKLKAAEAQYRTSFPDMPLPSEGM